METTTGTLPTPRSARRIARAEAAAWLVKLHGPHRSPEVERGFRAWLEADPENARQFERVTETWEAGAAPVPGLARVAQWRAPSRRDLRWRPAAAFACVLALGLGSWGAARWWQDPSYATGIGEQRIVRLTDGSRVILNADTRLSVDYRESERGVRILHGEALFEVAKDAARPFLVRAGEHSVKALGTTFAVRHEADRTAVTLVEGKVAVSAPGGFTQVRDMTPAAAAPSAAAATPIAVRKRQIVLAPGQRLTMAGKRSPTLDAPRPEAVTAWRRGEAVLDRTTLAEAVAEMNRYDQTALVIDDPDIAGLPVSGIYHTGDNEGFARTVARLYGLRVEARAGALRLRKPQ